MPITEDEYREPRLARYQERYPMSYDKNDRFTGTIVNPKVFVGRSVSIDGTGWKQPGYNPNHNSTSIEKINITTDNITLRPY